MSDNRDERQVRQDRQDQQDRQDRDDRQDREGRESRNAHYRLDQRMLVIERALFDEHGNSRIAAIEIKQAEILEAFQKARFVGWMISALFTIATPVIAFVTFMKGK